MQPSRFEYQRSSKETGKFDLSTLARYEEGNPQEKGEASQIMEKRCQVSMWTAGLNWYALPNLVVKAGSHYRQIGTTRFLELASIIAKMSFRSHCLYRLVCQEVDE